MGGFHHISVMPEATIGGLLTTRDGVYVDCTLGGAGHALRIASELSPEGWLIGIDQDAAAIAAASLITGCQTPASQPESNVKVVVIAESCVTNHYVMSSRRASLAMAAAGYLPVVLPDVADTNLLASAMDRAYALVLTGSVKGDDYRRRIKFEHRLIKMAIDRGIPVLGFCHGHQCINMYFGGKVEKMPLNRTPFIEHRSKTPPSVRNCFHMVDVKPGSRLAEGLGATRFKVNSSHSYSATKVGKGLVVTARADDGIVEAIEHETLPITGFQFHPESIFDLNPRFLRIITDALEHPAAKRRR